MIPNGYILYEGPSGIDKKPIVLIATGFKTPSSNPKTGPMIQTYIMRSDMAPTTAVLTENDSSICGTCKHRGNNGKHRTCYVQVQQGPNAVYKAYKAGKYDHIDIYNLPIWAPLTKERSIRLGSYGDPAALPLSLTLSTVIQAKNHTGYTHFWKTNPGLKHTCMASVDTETEALEAQKLGWRTFRVKNEGDPTLSNEVECPAVLMPGIIQCKTCKLCNGKSAAKNVVLNVHGVKWKIDKFKKIS